MKQSRLIGIDIFRGWAIILMVIFHFCYDLEYFEFINFNIRTDSDWRTFRYLILSMFIVAAGISLKLAHPKKINWIKLKNKLLLLAIFSAIISLGSYFMFPLTWIYFGILHFILFASLMALPFLNYPRIALLTAFIILLAHFFHTIHLQWLFDSLSPLLSLPEKSQDIVRFIPWFSLMLLGIAMVGLNWHNKLFNHHFFNKKSSLNSFISLLGRHALLIYIVHQPLFFGIFIFYRKL